jgi:hypothetical protein
VLFVSTPLHPFTPGRSSRGFTEPTAPNPSHTRRHFPVAQANVTLSEHQTARQKSLNQVGLNRNPSHLILLLNRNRRRPWISII